ncbi:MAG: AraC family transcriptional regulator [Candidatus Anaerobiospirillum merdipullorum]|uniref:AraC family transcriptional regulator n=1 Tax=Candidatus Anaerobiospirillum merdipullorum TaxID=2838450 RepID=A0A9E2KNF3_9GAMM|nr:AraC family transcriptional regulator [Candidatus Anaerobiospirillum merdipullorum]
MSADFPAPLSFGLTLLAYLCPLPYHVFKADNHYLEKFDSNDPDSWNVLKTDYHFRKEMLTTIRSQKLTLFCGESPVIYAGVLCHDGICLIIGPVCMTKPDQHFAKLYALKHNADSCALSYCDPARLAAAALLIYYGVTGRMQTVNELLDAHFLSEEVVQQTQKRIANVFASHFLANRPHNPVSLELNIRRAIRAGSVQAVKEALNSPYAAMRGTLAKHPLRSAQNLAIVDVTIATREAIDSGLSVEELYVLSDAYILQIEDCRYPAECTALARACAIKCAQLVAAQNALKSPNGNNSSLIVNRACAYIDRHVYERLNVMAMAEELKISMGYLSRLFKEGTGQTLVEYARKRKIELAATLLKDSDKSLSDIAQLLGFSSQSHFGAAFVREMKISPHQYRVQHKH